MTARRLSQQNPTLYDLGRTMTPFERRAWGIILLIFFAVVTPFVALRERFR
jgi:hypothetical protein